MVFRGFDGRLWLALHRPNTTPEERPHFIPLIEQGASLRTADTA
jgi:hypothetical protein